MKELNFHKKCWCSQLLILFDFIIEKHCYNWEKTVIIEKINACNKMNFDSNINEVIRAVLYFSLQKDFACTESTKSTKNHKNATKQKYKTQISEQK